MTREQSIEERLTSRGYRIERIPCVGGVRRVSVGSQSIPMDMDEAGRFLRGLEFGLSEVHALRLSLDAEEHACVCGEMHPLHAGGTLIGDQPDEDGHTVALFNCARCGSTRGLERR